MKNQSKKIFLTALLAITMVFSLPNISAKAAEIDVNQVTPL